MLEKNEDFVDHIANLLEYIDTHSTPEDSVKLFEELERVSADLKAQRHILKPVPTPVVNKPTSRPEAGLILRHSASNYFQRFEDDNAQVLNRIGKGLSPKDAAFIEHSLHTLSSLHALQFVFFGKILARVADYYVVFASPSLNPKMAANFEIFDPKSWKDITAYLNSTRFFVTSVAMDSQWKELPPILPKHVRWARSTKVLFDGKLDLDLASEGYPGTEGEYLHAQLLRIVAATFAAPKGLFKAIETEGGVKNEGLKMLGFDEEAKGIKMGLEDAMSLDNWVHLTPSLLKGGGFYGYVEPKGRSEEQLTEQREQVDTKDAPAELLAPLATDTPTLWKTRVCGDKSSLCAEEELVKPQAVVVLENNNWPGSMCCYSLEENRFVYFYLGFGVKAPQTCLQDAVAPVSDEPKMKLEQKEPNFVEEPPKEETPGGDEQVDGQDGGEPVQPED